MQVKPESQLCASLSLQQLEQYRTMKEYVALSSRYLKTKPTEGLRLARRRWKWSIQCVLSQVLCLLSGERVE